MRRLCDVYTGLLFLVMPLFVNNGYFDITLAKARCFWYITGAFLVLAAVLMVLRRERPGFDGRVWAFLVFAGMGIASSLLSGTDEVWLGSVNRYQGVLTGLLYMGVCAVLCSFGSFGRGTRTAMLTGFAAACALGIANHLGYDPLSFIVRLGSGDRGRFISTLGNVDIFGAYTTLIVPVCAYLALSEERSWRRAVLCALSALGLCALLASRCESSAAGLLAGAALLPVLFPDNAKALRRFPLMLSAAVAVGELYSAVIAPRGGQLAGLVRIMLSPVPAVAVMAVGAVMWLAGRRVSDERVIRARRVYCAVLSVLLVLSAVFLVLANTLLRERLGGVIGKYAVIDEDWGSDRGKVWRSFLTMFAKAPLVEKLIGGGAGCVKAWDMSHRIFEDAVTDNAHNEYLHYLLTNGLAGLGAYVLFLALSFRKAIRTPTGRCLLAGCTAYTVQAFANMAQPFTTPLFFVMLFCSDGEETEESKVRGNIIPVLLCAVMAGALILSGAKTGAPRPDTDPSSHEVSPMNMLLYTGAPARLCLSPGGSVFAEVPPHTALRVTGSKGEWMQVEYEGRTLYVLSYILVPGE